MHRNLAVLTTSLEIMNLLSASSSVKLFAVGGEYSPATKSFSKSSAIWCMEHYHVDKSFISCRSVSLSAGLTDTNDMDAILHKLALDHAHESYLAVDSSKLNRDSFAEIAPLSCLNGIILDCPFPKDWVSYLTAHHIRFY